MSDIRESRQGWLLSGVSANGSGNTALDLRAAYPAYYLQWFVTGNSAAFDLLVSYDATAWLTAATISAASNASGFSGYSQFTPYLAAQARAIYSAAGGSAVGRLYAVAAVT